MAISPYENAEAAEKLAKIVRSSALFDAEGYAKRVANLGKLDPAMHYVTVGDAISHSKPA